MDGYLAAGTKTVTIETGEILTYREVGKQDAVPLVLLQHFRGSLDSWDPALLDGLATNRRVIAFNNVGVASSSGLTQATIASMASGGMDTLPHNGAVITLLAVTGLTHRESYRDIFAVTVIKTLAVFFVIAVYYLTGIV